MGKKGTKHESKYFCPKILLLFHQIACCRLGLQKRKASFFQKSFRHKVLGKKSWPVRSLNNFHFGSFLWFIRTLKEDDSKNHCKGIHHSLRRIVKKSLGNSSPKKVVSSLKDIVPKPFLSFVTFKNHYFLKECTYLVRVNSQILNVIY